MAPHPQINSDPHALQPQGNKKYLEQSNAGNILALLGSLDSLAMIVVGLRLYVRISMLKSAGADDYIMTAAMVSYCRGLASVSWMLIVPYGGRF